ncbi:MAG: N-acetylglucosamine kinase [Rhizobiaceae bacterium]|nr:N-acetylglucosamine kinase [Rhizobiaceae bacterium]
MTNISFPIFGIDGGGTKCRAIALSDKGALLGEAETGAANVMTNFAGAVENITKACAMALAQAGLQEPLLQKGRAFIGVAGANVGTRGSELQDALPFSQSIVESDARIALQGAVGETDGVVAIIGTGSVFIAKSGDTIRTAGGWGFVVGDLGSGARLGRQLLEEALLAHDHVRATTPITAHVLNDFRNNPQTIVEYAHSASPGDFGRFAPLVLDFAERDDPTAKRIMADAVRDVEEALAAIVDENTTRLCLLGGLGRRYRALLSQRFARLLAEPQGSAVDGAIALARKHFLAGGQSDGA